ncbi:hypothetical protein ACFSCV_07205 [Methylopila henanensis]|uniref:Lipoprotein n=1 Tax=Methylopila henanensis TaxID=873516 RepID=A0ABW4K6T8_9HYPH
MRSGGLKGLGLVSGLLAGALALSACSTVGGDQPQQVGQDGGQNASLATKLIMGTPNPPPLSEPVDTQIKRDCPPVDVLDGAASFRAYATPGSADPFDIRYQASIADTARECSSLGVEAAIRVGVTGRVILGPKGSPGSFRLPLRIAVVDEKGVPVYSRMHPIDVTVPAGQTQADFPHIEDGVVVPIPANRFRGWKIMVGYDPSGATQTRASRAR